MNTKRAFKSLIPELSPEKEREFAENWKDITTPDLEVFKGSAEMFLGDYTVYTKQGMNDVYSVTLFKGNKFIDQENVSADKVLDTQNKYYKLLRTGNKMATGGPVLADPTPQNVTDNALQYVPMSEVCTTVDTVAPVSMLLEMRKSLGKIEKEVSKSEEGRGPHPPKQGQIRGIDLYVMNKLNYSNLLELCVAFSGEQVDAIANAIFQIERGQALIVADGTGVGKGRVASALIRYAKLQNKLPVFFTDKPNLFSDIYRDLFDIHSDDNIAIQKSTGEKTQERKVTATVIEAKIREDIANGDFELDYDTDKLFSKDYKKETRACIAEYRDLYFPSEMETVPTFEKNLDYAEQIKTAKRIVPFITNGRSSRSNIKDINGNIIYEGITNSKPDYQLRKIFESGALPEQYDAVVMTYSQVNSLRNVAKMNWIRTICAGAVIIMDESHLASGSSNTGAFLQGLMQGAAGVCFLSATFAKRPDNMPIYAMKTAMQETNMSNEALTTAILEGGVALQEILSSELAAAGQLLNRTKSYEGVKVNYNYLNASMLDRDVPLPQFNLQDTQYATCDKITGILRKIMAFQKDKVNPLVKIKDDEMTASQGGAQIADSNVDMGIDNPPVFSGVFNLINQLMLAIKAEPVADFAIMEMKKGKKVVIALANTMESFLDYLLSQQGDGKISADFAVIMKRRLLKSLEFTTTYEQGDTDKGTFDPDDYPTLADDYHAIEKEIEEASTGISISPIDLIKTKIAKAGFKVEEVTGRSKYVEFQEDGKTAVIKNRRKRTVNDIYRMFNNNELDCILINQSGAVGASAHSFATNTVSEVKYDRHGNAIIPSSLEPKDEIKQRVMIILQAELDVNKEVQKRGRILRTGQVFKPIYEYIFSAVPAERRLMMMLQKKLKSLDANISSNQKQSNKMLDVPDFLNVYGDKCVVEFMKEHPDINDLTGNVLKFENGEPTDATAGVDDKAHKVSGRIAILPIAMQEMFYNEITKSYTRLEETLKANSEWTLEVENMDLQAETLDKDVVEPGDPAARSDFGEAVFVEKCEVNNLRKPLKKAEVVTMLQNSLKLTNAVDNEITFRSPEEKNLRLQDELAKNIKSRLNDKIASLETSRTLQLKTIENMPSLEKKEAEERKQIIEEKQADVNAEYDKRIESLRAASAKAYKDISDKMEFFKDQRLIAYPLISIGKQTTIGEADYEKGLCIGLSMNFKAGNPFAPSQMLVRMVFTNGMRVINVALSDSMVDAIIRTTKDVTEIAYANDEEAQDMVNDWDKLTKVNQKDRVIRYIITGNILKGYGNPEFRNGGKLISYTTKAGGIKKGILLKDTYKAEGQRVSIPINKALPMLKDMQSGTTTNIIDGEVSIQRQQGDKYVLWIKKSKNSRYSTMAQDKDLSNIANNPNWDVSGGEFKNTFEGTRTLGILCNILWAKYKMSVMVAPGVFEKYADEFDIKERTHAETDGT